MLNHYNSRSAKDKLSMSIIIVLFALAAFYSFFESY